MAPIKIKYDTLHVNPYPLDNLDGEKDHVRMRSIMTYYNQTSIREHVLAPYVRANYRVLTAPEKIRVTVSQYNFDEELLFMPGSVIDRDPEAMVRRAMSRHGGLVCAGKTTETFEQTLMGHRETMFSSFCICPTVKSITTVDGYRRGRATLYAELTMGPPGWRKAHKIAFGWLMWVLLHPKAPACAPLVYTLINPEEEYWCDDEQGVGGMLYTGGNGTAPSAWHPGNLKVQLVTPCVNYERLYEDDDPYELYRRMDVTGYRVPHPYNETLREQINRAFEMDILKPGLDPSEYENIDVSWALGTALG